MICWFLVLEMYCDLEEGFGFARLIMDLKRNESW